MEHPIHEGVIISGQAHVTGPVAGGRHARAEQYTVAADDAAHRTLAELRATVQRHRDEFEEPDWIDGDLADVEREIDRPRPDRDRLVSTLQRLANRVSAVGAAATAVARLHEILTR